MRHPSAALIAALCVTCLASVALGDASAPTAPSAPAAPPFAHLSTPRVACRLADITDCVTLPPGYFSDEPTFAKQDAETKRAQDAETRLTAENTSFRATAATWQPGWKTLAATMLAGIAAGWYLHDKL